MPGDILARAIPSSTCLGPTSFGGPLRWGFPTQLPGIPGTVLTQRQPHVSIGSYQINEDGLTRNSCLIGDLGTRHPLPEMEEQRVTLVWCQRLERGLHSRRAIRRRSYCPIRVEGTGLPF